MNDVLGLKTEDIKSMHFASMLARRGEILRTSKAPDSVLTIWAKGIIA